MWNYADMLVDRESDQPQFKLDIRKDPIKEEDSEAQKALSDMANTLRAVRSLQLPHASVGGPC